MSSSANRNEILGITEYPWSSDEDNESPQSVPGIHSLQRQPEPPSNPIDMPGPSTSAPPAAPTSPPSTRRNPTRSERDFFWSIVGSTPSQISAPRVSSRELPGASLRPVTHTPVTEVRSPGLSAATDIAVATAAADYTRILAYRRLNRNVARTSQSTTSLYAIQRSPSGGMSRAGGSSSLPHMTALTDITALVRASARRAQQRAAEAATRDERGANDRLNSPIITPPPVRNARGSRIRDYMGRIEPIILEQSGDDDEGEAELERAASPSLLQIDNNAEGSVEVVSSQIASPISLEEEIVEVDAAAATSTPRARASPPAAENSLQEAADPNSSGDQTVQRTSGVKRKRDASDASDPHTVKEFNQNLLRLLECPVCLEWMSPPMSQCRRGHLVCARCRARLASCPVCRIAFSSVRNRAMEGVAELLRYPCRHGCGREVPLRRRSPHEASCAARRYHCVAPPCAQRATYAHHELAQHFQSKHMPMLKMGRRHKFSLRLNAELHDNWVVMALQQMFHLRVDVSVHTWGVVLYVAFIGPKCRAQDYTYEVSVIGQHSSRKIVYTRATHCDLERSTLNVSRQDCFHLTIDQAVNFLRVKNRHCEPDKILTFQVEISKSEDAIGAAAGNDSGSDS